MKRLLLFRHAIAADRAPSGEDFDRPLTIKGREDSKLVGAYLNKKAIAIDCVLCSPAARTRETWEAASSVLKCAPTVLFPDRLYKEGEEAIYREIAAAPGVCERLLIVGHNPGLESFARSLADAEISRAKPLARLSAGFPKGALARFRLDIDRWDAIRPRSGRLTSFKRPKDLRA